MSFLLKINLKNLQLISVILFPIGTVLGPFTSELFQNLSVIFFILRLIIEKKYYYIFNKYFILYISLIFFFILNSLFNSSNILLSLESSLFFFRFGLFSLVIWNLFDEFNNFHKYFLYSLVTILGLLVFDSFFQYINGYNILGYKYDNIRLGSFFNNEYVLGSFIWKFEILLLIFYSYLFKNNNKYDLYLVIFILLLNVLVLLSGERTSLFAMLFSSILLTFLTIRIGKIKLFSLIIFSIASLIIFLSNPSIKHRIVNYTIEQIGFGTGKINFFTEIHERHFVSAIKMFNQNKVLGVGPKLFREECFNDKYFVKGACATHPHNFYIQLLAETGFIGFTALFVIFLILLINLLKMFFYRIKNPNVNNDCYTASMILVFVYIWPFMPHMNFFNNWINAIPYLCVGILLYELNKKKIKKN